MKRKELTEEEIKEICEYYNTAYEINLHVLGKKYGISPETASRILKENNVILKKHKGLNKEQEKQLCSDYENGMYLIDVGKKYHIRHSKVKDILKKYDIHIHKRGELLETVLTEEQIQKMCYDYENGFITFEQAVDIYHKNEKNIAKILESHGITIRNKQNGGAYETFLKKDDIDNLIADYKDNYMSITDVINKYHISPKRLSNILKSNNIEQRGKKYFCGQKVTENICLMLDKDSDFQGKTLKDLINPETKNKLHPDVWMPKYKTIVEYDGEQHYKPIYGEKPFKQIQKTDELKEKYCQDHGYHMIRIDSRIFKTNKEAIQEYIIEKLLEFGYDIDIKL